MKSPEALAAVEEAHKNSQRNSYYLEMGMRQSSARDCDNRTNSSAMGRILRYYPHPIMATVIVSLSWTETMELSR